MLGVKLMCHVLQDDRFTVIQGETTTDNYFHINVVIPFIDHLQQELMTCFDTKNRIGKDIFILVPAMIIKETNLNDLACRLQFWKVDMPSPSSLSE